uniref:tRNA-intron lyase n=1 Tax=Lutzomyia longipalpis TaxID=7200 RepID=A0A1B0CEJ7_LUTLO
MSFRRKPGAPKHLTVITLPSGKHTGILKDFLVEIENEDSVKDLQENGCFGTRISRRKAEESHEKEILLVSKEEAFFMQFCLKCLTISNKDGKILSTEDVFDVFRKQKRNFISTFIAYCYLKSKRWIVKSGLKFAGDFLLYKESPQAYHSSYVVSVQDDNPENTDQTSFTGRDLQGFHRVAEASGKDVLILTVRYPKEFNSQDFKFQDNAFRDFSVTESRPMRFTFNPNVI